MDKENLYYYINKVYILFMHCLFRSILYKQMMYNLNIITGNANERNINIGNERNYKMKKRQELQDKKWN